MQLGLFLQSIASGTGMLWTTNKEAWLTVIQQACTSPLQQVKISSNTICQAPPLMVLWMYAIIQLDLLPCTVSLGAVYAACRYLGLKLVLR